jgi:hypothetical protein
MNSFINYLEECIIIIMDAASCHSVTLKKMADTTLKNKISSISWNIKEIKKTETIFELLQHGLHFRHDIKT